MDGGGTERVNTLSLLSANCQEYYLFTDSAPPFRSIHLIMASDIDRYDNIVFDEKEQ